jgi:hypothetical protein
VIAPFGGGAQTLTRLDPLTLRPRGPSLRLGEYHGAWSISPDRTRVALGMGSPGVRTCGAGVCIVDVASLRVVNDIDAPIAAEAVGWLSARRVAYIIQSGDLVVADPVTGQTLHSRRVAGPSQLSPATTLSRGRLVAVVRTATGRARLVVVDRQGEVRAADLRAIRLGDDPPLPPERAGVTVDPHRDRALVFPARGPVAEVDLGTLDVRYHRLRRRAAARAAGAGVRHATWLGRGLVAVAGEDFVRVRPFERIPAGVQVVDTRAWTARTVHPRASRAQVAGGRLLVWTDSGYTARGVGLRVYRRGGRGLVGRLFGGEALDVEVAGGIAYARGARALRVVRLSPPRVIRELRPGRAEIQLLNGRIGSG